MGAKLKHELKIYGANDITQYKVYCVLYVYYVILCIYLGVFSFLVDKILGRVAHFLSLPQTQENLITGLLIFPRNDAEFNCSWICCMW
jgi:hypothetical protein